MRNKRVKPAWSEAELRLPNWLREWTGYADDECNVKLSERNWRVMRNKALRSGEPIKVHIAGGEALLTDIREFLLAVLSSDRAKGFHDRAAALGLAVDSALAGMALAKANRQAGVAKAHEAVRAKAARGELTGRPKTRYRVTDGSGNSTELEGLDAVAAHTGKPKGSIAVQLTYGGGKAWLGRRDPETSWLVEKIGTVSA